jgi:hypothetical protein
MKNIAFLIAKMKEEAITKLKPEELGIKVCLQQRKVTVMVLAKYNRAPH